MRIRKRAGKKRKENNTKELDTKTSHISVSIKIDIIRRSINEDGINGKRESFSKSIRILRNVRRTNSSNTSSSANRGTSEQIDRLYTRQSENNNIKSDTTQSIGNQSRIENNQELAPTSSFFEAKTDNKGRQLSTQQQEYFKDSKVRDEKGNLLTVYHGTPNTFTEFNYDFIGSNETALGKGFYLTDDINIAGYTSLLILFMV